MKVAVVFVLLFASVLCRPAKIPNSSSESSEEVNVVNTSEENSDEQAAADTTETPVTPVTPVDDDDDDADETDTDEDDSDSSESDETSSPSPSTVAPVVTGEPEVETTVEPITPTVVTDQGRGDSLGGYPSDYKSIYVEEKSYQKVPYPYKSYEYAGAGKKMAYDMTDGNEVAKTLTVYKALQVHNDLLEEDTSTPEMESQALDASHDQEEVSPRQVALPQEEDKASSSASSSATEEESASSANSSASTSTSQESEDQESQSSEEATATPGAADSDSDESTESDSEEKGVGPDNTTDMPVVITAK
ncbi:osteopontin [Diretmus argenteus]